MKRLTKERKLPDAARCAVCGKQLHGVPRKFPAKMKKIAKTAKRPERPYGGYLCSGCMRELFKSEVRKKFS
jgi:large subunit ribosomal protein L34e